MGNIERSLKKPKKTKAGLVIGLNMIAQRQMCRRTYRGVATLNRLQNNANMGMKR